MASVVITIETDGAAFRTNRTTKPQLRRITVGGEVARILRIMAMDAERAGVDAMFDPRDTNGNPCGTVEVIE